MKMSLILLVVLSFLIFIWNNWCWIWRSGLTLVAAVTQTWCLERKTEMDKISPEVHNGAGCTLKILASPPYPIPVFFHFLPGCSLFVSTETWPDSKHVATQSVFMVWYHCLECGLPMWVIGLNRRRISTLYHKCVKALRGQSKLRSV